MTYKYFEKEIQNKRGTEPMWREAILVTMGLRFQATEWNCILGFMKDQSGGAKNGQFSAIKQHRDNMSSYTNSFGPNGMKKLNQEVAETKLKFYFHYLL